MTALIASPIPTDGELHAVRVLVEAGEMREEIEREISRGEFDGYRSHGQRWMADEEVAE